MFADQEGMRHHLLHSCLLFTAACSGGAGGGGAVDTREPVVPIIPDIIAGPAGTAVYQGQVALGFTAPTTAQPIAVDGDLTLQVNFDTMESAISGFASGFKEDTTDYVGTLFLDTGAIDDSSGKLDFAAALSGSLKAGSESYLIFGQMGGEFLGTGQQVASGQVLGTARQAGFDAPMSGQFQTARQ